MTQLEKLKSEFPNLVVDDGCFFANYEDWSVDYPLTVTPDSSVVLNAELIIEDHYENREILSNPEDKDPEKEIYKEVSGNEYIQREFGGSYSKAFKNTK